MLIATTNPDKLAEILAVLGEQGAGARTLADLPGIAPPEETGETFQENARDKALYYARATGMVTLAEDSGFEVAALAGEPGVRSARFLRPDASYPERFEEIYRRLRARGASSSAARYVCALALADGPRILFETTGTVEGTLAPAPAGHEGFGYDPIFFYPPYGKTFGEVPPGQKLAVSHRSRAVRDLKAFLDRHRVAGDSV